jgi:hypothetical protein
MFLAKSGVGYNTSAIRITIQGIRRIAAWFWLYPQK